MNEQTNHVFIVQFPHPGPEHDPRVPRIPGRMGWNTNGHKRKFMRSSGRYVDRNDVCSAAELTFWGEWEAPSDVVYEWTASEPLPRFLHVPLWEKPGPPNRQNTDPWVFGDCFLYGNCKQLTSAGNPSALQGLTPGSIILFGSEVNGEFVIDTVFVVKDSCPYMPSKPPCTEYPFRDDAFCFCTIESLCEPSSPCAGDIFTLYRGATFDERINGMYSFVPCKRTDSARCRFARPPIELPGYVNPKSQQTPSGAGTKDQRSAREAHDQWDKVRHQVLRADCLLGVWFQTPKLVGK